MHFLWISAIKDLRRLRREPVTILTWLAIPMFIAVILTLVFGPGGARPNGKLLVSDEDGGVGAAVLTSVFTQGSLGKMLAVEKVTRNEGQRRIEKGDASALLIIPNGFTGAFLGGPPVRVQLVRNPAQRILPDIIEETLSMAAEGAFYAKAGNPLRNQAVIQLGAEVIKGKAEQPGGFAAMLLPGTLFLAVFFVAGALAADVWRERTSGALRRIATAPVSLTAFLGGKLLATAVVLGTVGAFGLTAGRMLVDLRIANFPVAVLWIAASGSGLYLCVMMLQSLASSERVASLLTNFVLLPLTMLGGGFVPFEWMPRGLAQIGRYTPNGWSVVQLQAILAGSMEHVAFAFVAAFIAIAWPITVRSIRRNYAG